MKIILLIFTILLASHVNAKETLMACDAVNNGKRYYKLVDPWFGENEIWQKRDGQWIDWCRQPNCTKLEVYKAGGTVVEGSVISFSMSSSVLGTQANEDYFQEIQIWLDFEFLTRKVEYRLYDDETKTKSFPQYRENRNKTYNCELR